MSALSVAVLTSSCKKEPSCAKMGYEFVYTDYGVRYYVDNDSIPLGNSVTIEAAVPKTFFDNYTNTNVTLTENTISGPLSVFKATNDPMIPRLDATFSVSVSSDIGNCVIDSLPWGTYRKYYKTTFASFPDSFKLKINVTPNEKGIYFLGLAQQGNRDRECAVFRYFIKVKDTNQHLYFLEENNGGVLLPEDRDYAYCFKVY